MLSSMEAEYMALTKEGKYVGWLRRLLSQLGAKQRMMVTAQKNASCMVWANTGMARDFVKRKDIELRMNYVQQLMERGETKLKHVRTGETVADYLTKGLPSKNFDEAVQ